MRVILEGNRFQFSSPVYHVRHFIWSGQALNLCAYTFSKLTHIFMHNVLWNNVAPITKYFVSLFNLTRKKVSLKLSIIGRDLLFSTTSGLCAPLAGAKYIRKVNLIRTPFWQLLSERFMSSLHRAYVAKAVFGSMYPMSSKVVWN